MYAAVGLCIFEVSSKCFEFMTALLVQKRRMYNECKPQSLINLAFTASVLRCWILGHVSLNNPTGIQKIKMNMHRAKGCEGDGIL